MTFPGKLTATLALSAIILSDISLQAQGRLEGEEDPRFGLLIGISVWEELSFQMGLGYAFNQVCTEYFCFQEGVAVSAEYLPGSADVAGIRANIWTARLLAAGIGLGYYTDFDRSTILLQPEVGFGYSGVRLMFRVNIASDEEVKRAADVEVTASGLIDIF